jgi:hypothetical protein
MARLKREEADKRAQELSQAAMGAKQNYDIALKHKNSG